MNQGVTDVTKERKMCTISETCEGLRAMSANLISAISSVSYSPLLAIVAFVICF